MKTDLLEIFKTSPLGKGVATCTHKMAAKQYFHKISRSYLELKNAVPTAPTLVQNGDRQSQR